MKSTITEVTLAVSRWVELSIVGKATVMVMLGLTAARVKGQARASLRHLVLAAAFATLLVLPLVVLAAPDLTIEVPVAQVSGPVDVSKTSIPAVTVAGTPGNLPRTSSADSWSMPSWRTVIRSIWIAGAVLLLVSLAVDLYRVRLIRRHGLPWTPFRKLTQSLAAECGLRRPIEVMLHEDIKAPLTCGVWRPAIILPAEAREWSDDDLRRALVHEMEHARRGDWATQLTARVVCACYWFHPLVWMAWRQLCLEAERACDDAVVQSAEHTDYAEQLVSLSQRLATGRAQPVLGMANRSDLSRRISALLDSGQRRGRAGLATAASAMIVAGLLVTAVGPLRVVAQSTKPRTTNQDGRVRTDAEVRVADSERGASTPFDRALYEAAESGNTTDIEKLLTAGANVNCAIEGDGSPLMAAARTGHRAAAELLLSRGADPNMPVPGDGNPLIVAAREGRVEIVTLLLDKGANVDQVVPGDENALIQASDEGHLEVVKLLVTRGADVNIRVWVEESGRQAKGEWRSPLRMARKSGHKDVVDFLLAAGAREDQ